MANFSIGLDLGQSRDSSAAVLVERVLVIEPFDETTFDQKHSAGGYWIDERYVVDTWHVRHIRKWPLGTDYTAVVDDVADMFGDPDINHQAKLVMDYGGVGRGVYDMFVEAYRAGRLGDRWPDRVTLTGGFATSASTGTASHKGDVVSKLLAASQRGRVTIPPELDHAEALQNEIRAFTLKQSKTGSVRFEAKHESDHDDLLLALAMAVWRKHNQGSPRHINLETGALQEF